MPDIIWPLAARPVRCRWRVRRLMRPSLVLLPRMSARLCLRLLQQRLRWRSALTGGGLIVVCGGMGSSTLKTRRFDQPERRFGGRGGCCLSATVPLRRLWYRYRCPRSGDFPRGRAARCSVVNRRSAGGCPIVFGPVLVVGLVADRLSLTRSTARAFNELETCGA